MPYFWSVKTIPIWQVAEIKERKGSAAIGDQELKELWRPEKYSYLSRLSALFLKAFVQMMYLPRLNYNSYIAK